jgi:beta-mannan synthase
LNELSVQVINSSSTSLQVEQTGRAAAYGCFGFNGTGGVWRKAAIKQGGGWSWDSVTEDVALSYQAHLKGYRFIYLRDIPQLLEVPGNFLAHIQQKHRWTKVSLNCIRLNV